MVQSGAARKTGSAVAEAHAARLDAAGSHRHAHAEDLCGPLAPYRARDLDDFVHLLCAVYGRQPSVIELALHSAPPAPVRAWLEEAANAFERERLYLVRLTAAAGPIPSTPGAAETEAALLAQRHALETLARSERQGCALGAATALVADWMGLRPMLDKAAHRVAVEVPPCALPGEGSIADVLVMAADSMAAERAIRFGAEQLLLQHRAMFDLLEARSEAREDY
ncbi:DUF6975 family protein [Sphingomonas astaxanthinifaciens]|uniref:Uncharacterized protein n=1 Tax=Sphingomonas astaxanthinifaciens DSM 22298 TaxID=1123267 RepID=A0ABQ5Z6U4_9SPHN|nr:hypothetical protein [Sphingomonas astaxanthinifaciens]GLR47704.1 hypothetical protein GCM10007925_14170 [Sphingomonas astaxanthinifaciens DSM 22298]